MLLAAVTSLLVSAALVQTQQLDPIPISKDSTIYIDGGKQSFIDVDDDGKQTGNVTVGLSK
ncbi:MAG: hypothetical protein Q9168_003034 [Polycauliona sp. 1 TL-2023]